MKFVKQIARSVIYPMIVSCKLDYLLGLFQPNKKMILCFHGVTNQPNFGINNRHMPVQEFEKLIQYLSKHYEIVPVQSFFSPSQSSSKRKIAITFDDAYKNNLTTALPILEKYKVPAEIYVISQSIEDPDYIIWADSMGLFITANKPESIQLGDLHFKLTGGHYYSEAANINLTDYLKSIGREKYRLLHDLTAANLPYLQLKEQFPDYWQLMTLNDLTKISNSPLITIGSHTAWHLNLSLTPDEISSQELIHSKKVLESATNRFSNIIAYPDGSYSPTTKNLAEAAGYLHQLAVEYKDKENDVTDPRILPRMSVSNSTTHHSSIIRINLGFGRYGF